MKLKNYKIYKNPISQFIGLRFSKKSNNVLIFDLGKESKINSIVDTFFVFYPINVIWLDKNKKVVDTKKNVKSFSLFVMPKKKARYILEFAKPISVNIGDTINF